MVEPPDATQIPRGVLFGRNVERGNQAASGGGRGDEAKTVVIYGVAVSLSCETFCGEDWRVFCRRTTGGLFGRVDCGGVRKLYDGGAV